MEWLIGAAGTVAVGVLMAVLSSEVTDGWKRVKTRLAGRGERGAGNGSPVPAGAAYFVDREKETELADATLLPPAGRGGTSGTAGAAGAAGAVRPDGAARPVAMLAVSGMPGMGKSAFQSRWVDANKGRFSGRPVYVNFEELPGGTPTARLSAAVAEALQQLEVGLNHLPASLAGLTRLYRQESARRRLLVVLDEITEAAQVRALLPSGPGSAVLAAGPSRIGELTLMGAQPLQLQPLEPEHGLQLLTHLVGDGSRIGAEPEAARQAVEFCAGLPVALGIVGARLAMEPRLTLRALVAELSDEERRLEGLSIPGEELGVSAVIGMAYGNLPAEAARLYGRLGLLPGPRFDDEVAAAAGGLRPPAARRALARLESAGLVEAADEHGRRRFVSLVGLHARARGTAEPEAEQNAALARVVRHYVRRVAQADRAVMGTRLRVTDHGELLRDAPPGPFAGDGAKSAALEWLHRERAELLAVHEAAAAAEDPRAVWQLAEGLTALFLNHRYLQDWTATGLRGVEAAARDGEPAAEARLAALTSRPLTDLDRLDDAQALLERAGARLSDVRRGHAGYADLPVLRPSVLEFTGRLWDRLDPPRAIATYEEALAAYREAGEERGAAIARYLLGRALDAAGRPAEAAEALRAAVGGFEGLSGYGPRGDRRMAGRARAGAGDVLLHLGRRPEAQEEYLAAARLLQAEEAAHYEAAVREKLAALAREDGGISGQREHLARAAELYAKEGNPRAGELRDELRRLYPQLYPEAE
ncbi:NB-ARC domain-containing protein [Streptomyces synnematoformans]|uniref:NB-ARC domain-containing protein n=1 Tax=Streptomyces synnematoformans TaxID=415721 RepID=A0ABP5JJG8_9ACTN